MCRTHARAACLQERGSGLLAENSDLLLRVARLERQLALTQQANYDLQATVMGLQQRQQGAVAGSGQVRQMDRSAGRPEGPAEAACPPHLYLYLGAPYIMAGVCMLPSRASFGYLHCCLMWTAWLLFNALHRCVLCGLPCGDVQVAAGVAAGASPALPPGIALQFPTPSPGVGVQFPTPGLGLAALGAEAGGSAAGLSSGPGISTECNRVIHMLPHLRCVRH